MSRVFFLGAGLFFSIEEVEMDGSSKISTLDVTIRVRLSLCLRVRREEFVEATLNKVGLVSVNTIRMRVRSCLVSPSLNSILSNQVKMLFFAVLVVVHVLVVAWVNVI
jgi:hypothetical protein